MQNLNKNEKNRLLFITLYFELEVNGKMKDICLLDHTDLSEDGDES